jgi:hypothetical protein
MHVDQFPNGGITILPYNFEDTAVLKAFSEGKVFLRVDAYGLIEATPVEAENKPSATITINATTPVEKAALASLLAGEGLLSITKEGRVMITEGAIIPGQVRTEPKPGMSSEEYLSLIDKVNAAKTREELDAIEKTLGKYIKK